MRLGRRKGKRTYRWRCEDSFLAIILAGIEQFYASQLECQED
jgi:hypothetical protein